MSAVIPRPDPRSPRRPRRLSPVRRLALAAATPLLAAPLAGWVQLTIGDANDPPMRWSAGTSIPYHIHSDGYSGMPLNRVRAALDAAFATWELPCSNVTSAPDRAGRDGDTPAMDGQNIVRFEERALPRDVDPESVLAFTMHVGVFCTGTLAEADITFNAVTFGWTDGDNRNLGDVETVALHEIGHLLGLGHTGFDWAVMYPSIQERVRRDLSRDEEDAICSIYGGDLGGTCERNADCGGGEVCIVVRGSVRPVIRPPNSAMEGAQTASASRTARVPPCAARTPIARKGGCVSEMHSPTDRPTDTAST